MKRKRSSEFLFSQAIELVRRMGGHTIVEIGSIRDADGQQSDGHSTLAWAESGFDVWSVDVDMRATQLTDGLLGDRYPRVSCINGDGIRFLDTFPQKIDLLYLDGPDPDGGGRRWAADAFVAALPRFSHRAVLLVDDTDLPRRGKGEFAIPLAESAGFTLLTSRRLLLWRGLAVAAISSERKRVRVPIASEISTSSVGPTTVSAVFGAPPQSAPNTPVRCT